MATMDTTNPLNMGLVSKLKLKATEVSSIEAVLESAPQLMLQIHILLTTGKISELKYKKSSPIVFPCLTSYKACIWKSPDIS